MGLEFRTDAGRFNLVSMIVIAAVVALLFVRNVAFDIINGVLSFLGKTPEPEPNYLGLVILLVIAILGCTALLVLVNPRRRSDD